VYFSVDVEASGPMPPPSNLLSIGAVETRPGPEGLVLGREFYVELKPIAPGFDPEAMKVHGIPRKRLETEGTEAAEAMRRLSEFVAARLRKESGRAVFVGHNAAFDWSFISYYFTLYRIANPFGYKALDSKSLAMGRLGIGWFETHKDNLETLLGLPPQDASLTHRADYDAHYQALILCGLLNRR